MKRLLLAALFASGLSTAVFAGGTITWPTPPLPPGANPAAIGVPPVQSWLNRFAKNVTAARAMGKIDLIFDGETVAITNGQYGPRGGMWQRFARFNAVDFSSPGDSTQVILWRLQQGQLKGLDPKLVVLEVGGGNAVALPPDQAAAGIKAVLDEYQKECPNATIVLMSIFPRGPKSTDAPRAKIDAVNKLISAYADGKKVIFLDVGSKMLQPDGSLTDDYAFQFPHPTLKGYQVWADALEPMVDQFFPQGMTSASAPTVSSTNATSTSDNSTAPVAEVPSAISGTITWPPPPLPAGANPATTPAPPLGWITHFQQNLDASRKKPKIDLIFDGDSITQGWVGGAGAIWHKHYDPLNAFDFGISGNTTQDVVWRVENGQVDGLHPKLVVLLIGTNNMFSSSAEQIAGGIKAGVDAYRKHLPDTTVLLLGIFPRGNLPTDGLRAKVKAVNAIISKYADGDKIRFLDFGDKLLQPGGIYGPPITGDFLHPSLPGYQIWVDSIQPIIDEFFPPSVVAPAPAAAAAPAPTATNSAPATSIP